MMNPAMEVPGHPPTFLTHYFGRGLADEKGPYAVERFVARADGDVRRIEPEAPKRRGRRKAAPLTASLKAVKAMRPARNEIIVCTALNVKNSGVAYWGWIATGLFCDRKQRR